MKNRDKKTNTKTLSGSREFVSTSSAYPARNLGRDSTKDDDDDDAKEESRARGSDRAKETHDFVCTRSV